MVIDRQWNSLSELCVTILSRILARGLSRIQRVITSPSSSRSLAFVAVKTLAPMTIVVCSLSVEESPKAFFPARPAEFFETCALHTLSQRLLQRLVFTWMRLDGGGFHVKNAPFPKGAHAWRHCSAVRWKLKSEIPSTRR